MLESYECPADDNIDKLSSACNGSLVHQHYQKGDLAVAFYFLLKFSFKNNPLLFASSPN